MTLQLHDESARPLLDRIAAHLPETGRIGVAFSGGVDSTVLLAACHYLLGPERTLGILAVSASLAARERAQAHDVAEFIGAEVVEVTTKEQELEGYRANDVDRCYFCKTEMFDTIDAQVVASHGLGAVAYGENADDALRPDRPGAQAATEHNVLRPLAAAGLTKAEVRSLAHAFALPNADKPAAPCLASRIPHGMSVDPEKLAQIEALELALYRLGFSESRVRHHGTIARIELPRKEMARALELDTADAIHAAAIEAGFTFAAVDVRGIQSGVMTLTLLLEKGKLSYAGANKEGR
ncbi:ATP-dependent sacrificial sulfur transferase LarE [Corynebacterium uterequi]|uniref:Putative TIGR00268 family protein n=1 Tax=Corynebacterium uterequi TaxID=1072256 RepID=A0A0G3HGU9_9CORY|nr:ATP-dependent sacrificial sulfur transferase LarE [Corynebacterium uterequi]AKK12005.1 putative TIGR00268 family protein [Corynebacterium uterequi]